MADLVFIDKTLNALPHRHHPAHTPSISMLSSSFPAFQPAIALPCPNRSSFTPSISSFPTLIPLHPYQRTPTTPLKASLITILDYGAGNVRSLENAVRLLGHDIRWAKTPSDIVTAEKLIFPGVGSFGAAMHNLHIRAFIPPLKQYLSQNRPFLGICLGLHTLFDASDESPEVPGLGVIPGRVRRFEGGPGISVPHIGWNTIQETANRSILFETGERFYFVHSYRVGLDVGADDAATGITTHGEPFVSILQKGRICATQFHPEKSGAAGIALIQRFVAAEDGAQSIRMTGGAATLERSRIGEKMGLAKRVVACLDVRENDTGDLVVTKGDQYDVREKGGEVRNLGKPVELAKRYFREGADEVCFLNITSFRGEPVGETGMIEVLQRTSREVFVPLCIGGGIRDYIDKNGREYSALEVAEMYFRAGADKVSIGSDAVYAVEKLMRGGGAKDGSSSIERISHVYGAQAVVVSVDPRRVYLKEGEVTRHDVVRLRDGRRCWYQCTVKGGREGRDVDVIELVKAVEALGAGEILLNCMDCDGRGEGFDVDLVRRVKEVVGIPVIASSGAGCTRHFVECFEETGVEAALAAGIFHRREVAIADVKEEMRVGGIGVRMGGDIDKVVGAVQRTV